MITVLSIVHILVCVFLILVVLLQSGKGADLAGAFGGGGTQTALGARGTATFLGKLTTIAAIAFMLTSLTLSIMKTRGQGKSRLKEIPAAENVSHPEGAAPAHQPSTAGAETPGNAQPETAPAAGHAGAAGGGTGTDDSGKAPPGPGR